MQIIATDGRFVILYPFVETPATVSFCEEVVRHPYV
jgi:hypothetical protein